MVLDDASEEEAEELFPDSTDKVAAATRENRKEREDKLKKMMDEDDDDDEADGMPWPSNANLERNRLTWMQTRKCPMPMKSHGSPRLLSNRHHQSQRNLKKK